MVLRANPVIRATANTPPRRAARSVAVQATVRRDGASLSVPIDQLVPGDIVELIAGDLIPADSRFARKP